MLRAPPTGSCTGWGSGFLPYRERWVLGRLEAELLGQNVRVGGVKATRATVPLSLVRLVNRVMGGSSTTGLRPPGIRITFTFAERTWNRKTLLATSSLFVLVSFSSFGGRAFTCSLLVLVAITFPSTHPRRNAENGRQFCAKVDIQNVITPTHGTPTPTAAHKLRRWGWEWQWPRQSRKQKANENHVCLKLIQHKQKLHSKVATHGARQHAPGVTLSLGALSICVIIDHQVSAIT